MNLQSLKPASEFARIYGAKSIIYGAPGSAKTPLINTAPRPLMLACEPGLLSMRGSTVPTFQAYTGDKIDEFFDWFNNSNERRNFDTLAVDSGSQMTDIYLQEALNGTSKGGSKVHGKAAYGQAATNTMRHLRKIYYADSIHVYLIAKEGTKDNMKWPYWPGQQLNTEVPHLYDFILHLGIQNIPGMGQRLAFRCVQAIDVLARNRTGNLNEFEEPHFGKLVAKAMS